ncbi:MAG: hypothetical protein AVO39_08535 [delta proteobacterium MLS_D]|jgi:oxygen-independent coproporphyrinogen III oxidase|nr:MAG: hypothetical protein AVO39_08535 [delta proteobacterium MLS_D]
MIPDNNTSTLPGLYIHVPFCVTKCPYCNFYSVTDRSAIPSWINALRREMNWYKGEFEHFDTVYLGGGTPSVLSPNELAAVLDGAYEAFTISGDCEVTIEANPGDIDEDFLSFLRDTPVNRVNLGVQSFDDAVLAYLGRRHDSEDCRTSINLLRNSGYDNIGLDLIYAVPGQSMKSWKVTLEEALRWKPEHLSCYELTLETGTPMGRRFADGDVELPGEDERYDFFMTTSERLEKDGYIHYEVSNFARRETFRSRHNMKYWNHVTYLGLGPSAHSFSGNRRWWNHASVERYISDLEHNRRPLEERESLTDKDLRLERVFLGLRTIDGIDGNDPALFDPPANNILQQCLADGLLEHRAGRIVPTRRGLALADQLAVLL